MLPYLSRTQPSETALRYAPTLRGSTHKRAVRSSAILEATLLRLGPTVEVYLSHRNEGYDLSESAVHHFSRAGTKLLIRQIVPELALGEQRQVSTRRLATATYSRLFINRQEGIYTAFRSVLERLLRFMLIHAEQRSMEQIADNQTSEEG